MFGKHLLQKIEPLSELDIRGRDESLFVWMLQLLPTWASVPSPPCPLPRPGNYKGNNGDCPTRKTLPSSRPGPAKKSPLPACCGGAASPGKGRMFPTSEVQVNTPEMSCLRLWKSFQGSCFLWEEHTVRGKQAEISRTPGSAAGTTASSPDVISMNMALSQGKNRCFKSEWTWLSAPTLQTLVESFLKTGQMPPTRGPTPEILHLVTSLKSLAYQFLFRLSITQSITNDPKTQ